MPHSPRETEIKLSVTDVASGRRILRTAGFRVTRRRVFEANTVYDTAEFALRKSSRLLRLREAGRVRTMTFKGAPEVTRHKSREELETDIPDLPAMAAILERLGFRPVFRYEKYRTEFRRPGSSGLATLDETPVGVYIELEGAPAWIDRTARAMSFAESDYITASYGRLYLEWCERKSIEPSDMMFAKRGTGLRPVRF
jgi:adenylate cyclase class 2